MEQDELVKKIKEIIGIAEQIPEKYQKECFTVLLDVELKRPASPPEVKTTETPSISETKFIIPIDVLAFLQQFSVPEEKLSRLFFMQGNEVRTTFRIETDIKSKAQMQVAVLTSLEKALKGGKFEFNVEDVRNRCKEQKCYDSDNFKGNFKSNDRLFRSLSDEEHVELSPDGKAELAEAVLELAK